MSIELNIMKKSKLITLVIILTAFPSTVFANAATPLMLVSFFHLFIGNAIIGIIEGLILSKIFKLKKVKSILLLISANYFSAWIGYFLLDGFYHNIFFLNLYNAYFYYWKMVFIAYIATLIFEWPFIFLCFSKFKSNFKKSIYGTLLIQTISYFLLFGGYWIICPPTLYSEMNIVPASEISLPKNVTLYFINNEDGDIYSMNFSTNKTTHIFSLSSEGMRDRLGVQPSATNSNKWDLFVRTKFSRYAAPNNILKILELSSIIAPFQKNKSFRSNNKAILGSATNSNWKCYSFGRMAMYSPLILENKKLNQQIFLSFETLFGYWKFLNVIHLPENKIIFQLGDYQICILDINNKKIALLEYGRGPIAVINEK